MVKNVFWTILVMAGLALGITACTPEKSEAGPVWRWVMRRHDARVEHRVAMRAARRAEYSVSVAAPAASYSDCGRSAASTYSDCGRSASFVAPAAVELSLPVSPGVGDRSGPVAGPYRGTSLTTGKAAICRCGPNCICGPTCTGGPNCNCETVSKTAAELEALELEKVLYQAMLEALQKFKADRAARAAFET